MHRNPHKATKHVACLNNLGMMRQFRKEMQRAVRAGLPTFSLALYKHAQKVKLDSAMQAARADAQRKAQMAAIEAASINS